MRIQPTSGMPDLTSLQLAAAKPRQATLGHDELALAGSKELDHALEQTPDVRADKVARARSLVQDPTYPSADVIRAVSDQLAQHLEPGVTE